MCSGGPDGPGIFAFLIGASRVVQVGDRGLGRAEGPIHFMAEGPARPHSDSAKTQILPEKVSLPYFRY